MRILSFVCVWIISASCLAVNQKAVFEEVSEMDKRFFAAFNTCDFETMGEIFSKDLEFYHDISGYAGYEETMDVTRINCDRKLGLKRELEDDSMSIHALGEFGALQKGMHTFCHMVYGKNDCGTFEFVHIWKKEGRNWELYRVISYGH